jgi:AraC-like DNA-binding protein
MKRVHFFWLWVILLGNAWADVVKPALVEVVIFPDYRVELTIDLSLEAAMSNISTQYQNTQDSPNAEQYDTLRVLEPKELLDKFLPFSANFLQSIELKINHKVQSLTLSNINIDIKGYTKRPRKTILKYSAQVGQPIKTLQWQFRKDYGDSAFRYQLYIKDSYNWSEWRWLRNGQSSGLVELNQKIERSTMQRFLEFIVIGFDHVIPLGWDHILFIIGMALSTLMWRHLLLLVSTFTLAHTLTLGLAMLGLIEITPRIIEPLIAFSISYVAIENLFNSASLFRRSLVVFAFGLIHGLGFASMLKDFEMNDYNFMTTLIGFNVGVELAQIIIVITIFGGLLSLKNLKLNYRKVAIIPISILISLVGFWWGVERLMT